MSPGACTPLTLREHLAGRQPTAQKSLARNVELRVIDKSTQPEAFKTKLRVEKFLPPKMSDACREDLKERRGLEEVSAEGHAVYG